MKLSLRPFQMRRLFTFLLGTGFSAIFILLIMRAGIFTNTLSVSSLSGGEWGSYPKWWTKAWAKSAVARQLKRFMGVNPLFPPCTDSLKKGRAYGFVAPHTYLPNCRNPCWYESPKNKKGLKCVPYFYLAGVAKGGTTDLAKRLRMHPELFQGTQKEYHWWERDRFGTYDEEDPESSLDVAGGVSFKDYCNKITGKEVYELQNELKHNDYSVRIFGDFSPSYLWDPQNWYALDGNQGCLEPRIIVGQHIRNVFPDAKILMTFRHPTPRLYSRFVSRISRTPALRGATPEDFHKHVVDGIQAYKRCYKQWSIRHCAYNVSVYKESLVRLVEGMYPVFMADWLRVWPREQMLILRYEDYGGHERERLSEVIEFLGLSPLNRTEMDKLMVMHAVNAGTQEYKKYGAMLPKTKTILDEFYRPFISKFAEIMQDQRFLWADVPH